MQSNFCVIEKGTKDLDAIFKESEKVAEYNGLSHKQALHLRLLCEEIDGMLPKVIDNFSGKLWIEYDSGVCKVRVSVEITELNPGRKRELIEISTNKKNASAVGIVGKIRNAIEDFLLNEEEYIVSNSTGFTRSMECIEGADYKCIWSLDEYRGIVNKEDAPEAWDELEKSIIASVADNVLVGVKGNRADITIIKKFS